MKVLWLVLVVGGCQAYPYVEIGAGYKNPGSTSAVLIPGCDYVTLSPTHTQREYQIASCGGQNPTAHINVGFEFEWNDGRRWLDRCELSHWSHFRDGRNGSRRETHKDEIVCYVKWGGRPR